MIERRAVRSTRVAGFTPVRNARIDNRIETIAAMMMLASAEQVKRGGGKLLDATEARKQAIREVARTLPAAAMTFDWRIKLPCKNIDPEYRREGGPVPA